MNPSIHSCIPPDRLSFLLLSQLLTSWFASMFVKYVTFHAAYVALEICYFTGLANNFGHFVVKIGQLDFFFFPLFSYSLGVSFS